MSDDDLGNKNNLSGSWLSMQSITTIYCRLWIAGLYDFASQVSGAILVRTCCMILVMENGAA